jgi:hypothetical protein
MEQSATSRHAYDRLCSSHAIEQELIETRRRCALAPRIQQRPGFEQLNLDAARQTGQSIGLCCAALPHNGIEKILQATGVFLPEKLVLQ